MCLGAWGVNRGWGHKSLGTYNRKGWEIREGFSEEVMAESHVQDLRELTRCRMGLRQETKKEPSCKGDRLEQKCKEHGKLWGSKSAHLLLHLVLRERRKSLRCLQGPAWPSPWLGHLFPILFCLSHFYLPRNATPTPQTHLWDSLAGKQRNIICGASRQALH